MDPRSRDVDFIAEAEEAKEGRDTTAALSIQQGEMQQTASGTESQH